MNKIFAPLLLTAFLLLGGCHKKTVTTEIVPAQLELIWVQSVDQVNLRKLQTAIPSDMAKQLTQIGDYRSSSQITYTNQKTEVEFKLVFLKEISDDDIHELLPKLKSIFKDKTFKITFRGRQKKHIIRESYGPFAHTEKETRDSQIVGTGTLPGVPPNNPEKKTPRQSVHASNHGSKNIGVGTVKRNFVTG